MADLYEVIDALMQVYQIQPEVVLAKQTERRRDRGGFDQRIRLVGTGTS